jgi:O-antigen ligase
MRQTNWFDMSSVARTYQRSVFLPSFIFLASGVTAIYTQQPFWLLVPFLWILIPVIFKYTVTQTEQLYWLLFITLPLSTELTITPQLGIDFPDEILLILLSGITVLKFLHQPGRLQYSLLKHPLFMVLTIYISWIVLTCLYAVEPLLSVKYLLAKIWYIIPFVLLPQVILQSKDRLQKMAICLLVPMGIVVLLTLLRHAYYGFSFENIRKVMGPFFRNHVNYSSMLVCLLPVAWCVWKLTPPANPRQKWIAYGIAIGLAGLLLAYSRGAWIAFLAGVAVVWVIRKKMMAPMITLMITGIIISTVWLVTDKNYMHFAPDHDRTVFHTAFGEHMLATVEMKDVSTAERFYRWIAGARMLADKPVTGFGPNSFYLHYRPYTVNRFETWVSNNPEHSTVHNYFILVALEQGVIGLFLFCTLYFGMLLHIQRLYHRFQSRFYRLVTLTTGIVLVMIGVINSMSDMIETDKIGSLFWLCLGMIILLDGKSKKEKGVIA